METPSEPNFSPAALSNVRDLWGNIQTFTTEPTFTPRKFSEQFAIYAGYLYFYDFTSGAWFNTEIAANYHSPEYNNGNATGTKTIDWSNSNTQYITLTGDTTLTFTNPQAGQRMLLHVKGAATPTFPSTVRWPSGVTPIATATSNKKDIYAFTYSLIEDLYDGIQTPNYATI